MKRLLLVLLAGLLIGGGGFAAYNRFFKKPETRVLESARVERGDIRGVLVETGIIKPQVGALVKIGSRITGAIVSMNVKIGDRVKRGDLIALIDDREVRRNIERQKAVLESAKNTLREIELTYPLRIREAQANHDYAKINYQREQELIKHEYTTRDAVDKARSISQSTDAILKRLQDEQKTQLDINRAKVDETTAQIRELEVNLSYTRIEAPIDGIISDVTLQEGETIVTGLQVANLVTVLDPTRLEMWIYVDETDIGKVKVDQRAEYYVDTYPDRTFTGNIGKINPQPVVKENIVYYLAIVEVATEYTPFLKPEMTTHARIIVEEKTGILTTPNAAVKFEEGRQVVYKVIGENRVEKLEIKTGLRGEDRTEILSGILEGDEVATKIILPVASKS